MSLLIPLIGLLLIVGLSSLNWRLSVKATFVILILEGVLRKWVFPQASDLIYFLKDLVLLGAYLSFYFGSESKYPLRLTFFTTLLFTSAGWFLIEAFNRNLGSPFVGLLGFKSYLFYIPMMWMLPSLFNSEEDLFQYLRNYLLLVIPVALLAIAQFYSPISSPINIYAAGMTATAAVDGNARVTGTFPYIAGYSTYLSFCFSILIPLITLPQPKIWQILTFIEILLVFGTSFMTGARGLLLFEVLFVVGYFCMLLLTSPSTISRSLKKFVLPIALIIFILPRFFDLAIEAFFKRATTSDNLEDRVFSSFAEPEQAIKQLQKNGLDSYGIGATHQAATTLRQVLELPMGEEIPPSEGEMGRVILETGPIGFFLWYALRLVLIISLLGVFLKLKTPFLRNLALAAFLFHCLSLTAQVVFNNTLGIYYWLFSSFIFLLPELEHRQRYV